MPATSTLLVREGQTDFAPFSQPDISTAHTQWLLLLNERMNNLDNARIQSEDFDLGGTCISTDLVQPLEELVDEARRMVCILGGELRRRSEGNLQPWSINQLNQEKMVQKRQRDDQLGMGRAISAGQ
ncbi:uncharacterized protein L201_005626 [Kwoniella dendrophila CBS 6074]|uniref:Uncharacterized protein n=1 Tax=Kwoniella dendrophila CBS 6074 TaxID=1295534 RepID=A0AAX4JZT2_9TREE